jgi:hypothetical protein
VHVASGAPSRVAERRHDDRAFATRRAMIEFVREIHHLPNETSYAPR